jgi:hypothetical protein
LSSLLSNLSLSHFPFPKRGSSSSQSAITGQASPSYSPVPWGLVPCFLNSLLAIHRSPLVISPLASFFPHLSLFQSACNWDVDAWAGFNLLTMPWSFHCKATKRSLVQSRITFTDTKQCRNWKLQVDSKESIILQ